MANRAGPAVAAQPVQSLPPRQLAAQDPERAVLDARAQAIEDALADLRAPPGALRRSSIKPAPSLLICALAARKMTTPLAPRSGAPWTAGMSVRC